MSVRSGAKFSMPGMMNTILNLGLNDRNRGRPGPKRSGNPRFAYDSYRRFIQMFGEVALDIDMEKFDHIFDARKHKAKVKLDTDLTADDLKAIIADYKKLVQKETKKPFPQDPHEQLVDVARRGVPLVVESEGGLLPQDGKDSGRHRHRGQRAGDGVRQYGRHVGHRRRASRAIPATGEKVFYGEFLINAQGEDVVAGIRTPQPISRSRESDAGGVQAAARDHRPSLEKHYRDMQDFEFTIEDRQAVHAADAQRQAHRSGGGARRGGDGEEGMIDKKEAVLRVRRSSSISCCIRCSTRRR